MGYGTVFQERKQKSRAGKEWAVLDNDCGREQCLSECGPGQAALLATTANIKILFLGPHPPHLLNQKSWGWRLSCLCLTTIMETRLKTSYYTMLNEFKVSLSVNILCEGSNIDELSLRSN